MKLHYLKKVNIFCFLIFLFFTLLTPVYAEIYDDFNGNSIDTNKWRIGANDPFNQTGGALEIKASPYSSRGSIVSNTRFTGDFDFVADWCYHRFNSKPESPV